MPTVRYTADGGIYRVGGYGFDPGDEKDVDDELADYLADRDDFEVVDDATDTAEVEPDAEDGFDVDEWLDQGYTERADRVRSGEVDEHLDVIHDAETSENVIDAVALRTQDLED